MNRDKIINGTRIAVLGVAVLSALSGYTNVAIAGIGIYLTSLHLTEGN